MTPKGLLPLVCTALVALAEASSAQGLKGLNLRVFRLADGLAESACLSVTVTPQGKVLVRHTVSSGISELSGYAIKVLPAPGEGSSRVYGSPGGQLWTVSRQGLEEFKNDRWVLHPVPEIAAEFNTGLARVTDPVPLCPVKQGQVLLLLPERLLEFNAEGTQEPGTRLLRSVADTRLERFSGMTAGPRRRAVDYRCWRVGEGAGTAAEPEGGNPLAGIPAARAVPDSEPPGGPRRRERRGDDGG